MTSKILPLLFSLLFIADSANTILAQYAHDFRHRLDIPEIINVNSSETHLYVLSESEGLVVFRAYNNSLQWLYSSTGMQQRGHKIDSDIRFAYIFGDNRRLTVVEPTSVLGVYSSTVLPAQPLAVKRIANDLYLALGNDGLGRLSLNTPESVDSEVDYPFEHLFEGTRVQSLATDKNQTLYVLSNNDRIDIFSLSSEDSDEPVLQHEEQVNTDQRFDKIFLTDSELIGSDRGGNIYLVNSDGRTRRTATVNGEIDKLRIWNNQLVVRTQEGNLWIGELGDELTEWKSESRAGNYFTVTEDQLWVAEFNQLSPVVISTADDSETRTTARRLSLQAIDDIILPFPRPLILPIKLDGGNGLGDVSFSYSASFNNARIRGNTFYWQPSATQTGRHRVTITATNSAGQSDSQEFMIDLRPFNAPPRFSSARPISIPIGEPFEYKVDAIDPDGMNQDLIRY
ncbi:Ig domain-containing protein, partial [Rhodohalobacter halophilus]|uniref:Ig domain-containing protein n=1 Tax=Rhodohalobacter halophilus TaxID=1812810 RepID=UPI00114CB49F